AVHTGRRDLFLRELLERPADQLLQRMRGVEVGPGRPAGGDAGGEHAGVLAGAVHRHPRGLLAGPDPADSLGLVDRPRRRTPQRRLVEARVLEQAPYAVDVERLTGVAARGEREELPARVQPGPQHA